MKKDGSLNIAVYSNDGGGDDLLIQGTLSPAQQVTKTNHK